MKSVAIESFHENNDKRIKVEWQFSKRCNFDCSYCSKYLHDNKSQFRSFDDYTRAVDKLMAATNKKVWLSFSGGEACIYPHLKDLLRYCRGVGVEFLSVCSNGSRGVDYYVDLMEELDNIIISCHFEYKVNVLDTILAIRKYIEGKQKDMHVHVMMLPGHFEQAKELMRKLKENDVLFGVRRIRPLYMPDGTVARPYQKGGDLKLTKHGPDYSDDQDYYSPEELELFKRNIHDYI